MLTFLYARVSTKKQFPSMQMEILEEFAMKNGFPPPYKKYFDVCSGNIPWKKRKEMSKMFLEMEKNSVLIFMGRDRLARDIKVAWDIDEIFDEKECRLINLMESEEKKFFDMIKPLFEESLKYKENMKYIYDITNLEKAFEKHSSEVKIEPVSEDMPDNFNLPLALCVMCQEIIDLRKEVTSISDNIHGYDP